MSKTFNTFKTSDISLHKDSQGFYAADHKYQGNLIDCSYYETRTLARRDAVEVLKEKKWEAENPETFADQDIEAHHDFWARMDREDMLAGN